MKAGDPIWVESLMTPAEYKEAHKLYPTTVLTSSAPAEFDCEFKWRKGMGAVIPKEEIDRVNKNLDLMRKKLKP